jgi:agmatine/peptidylarginine deiminase
LKNAGIFADLPMQAINLVLEGGGIESDGQGSLLATQDCLASSSRNPTLSLTELEEALRQQLGIQRFLWLKHGHLLGDDTDGHIDTLARFCDDNTIAYVSCDDPNDAHYASLSQMAAEVAEFRTSDNHPYTLVPLPLPAAIYSAAGERLPATYANFLIINDAVLVPTYNDPQDAIVLQRLESCFPQRNIIAIDCRTLIQQFGSLHCVTMQFPQGVLR